jgi:hypothetical protein
MEQINMHRAEALQRRVQTEVVVIAAAAFASILDHVNASSEVTNDLLIVRTLQKTVPSLRAHSTVQAPLIG